MATPSERVLHELSTLTGQQKYDLLLELLRGTEVSACGGEIEGENAKRRSRPVNNFDDERHLNRSCFVARHGS